MRDTHGSDEAPAPSLDPFRRPLAWGVSAVGASDERLASSASATFRALGLPTAKGLPYNGGMDDARRIPLNGPETIDKATSRVEAGERVMLTRDGLDVAALVEPEAAELLEHLEDVGLASLAAERMEAFRASGEAAIPLADVAREIDLDAAS